MEMLKYYLVSLWNILAASSHILMWNVSKHNLENTNWNVEFIIKRELNRFLILRFLFFFCMTQVPKQVHAGQCLSFLDKFNIV